MTVLNGAGQRVLKDVREERVFQAHVKKEQHM